MRSILLLAAGAVCLYAADPIHVRYKEASDRLIDAALADNGGYEKLSYLCDRIGNRLASSRAMQRAVAWAAGEMKKDGLTNVAMPAVKVPKWVRGRESAALVAPVARPLHLLGLGGSVGTPKGGITAEVVPVRSFAELDRLGPSRVAGKMVLYNVPFTGYGPTVRYRTDGAAQAARLGAVAALVRSVTPVSLQSPHTGAMRYAGGVVKIPSAAVTIEDATLIQRLVDAGNRVKVHLAMEAHMAGDADSANVVGEIVGRVHPEEIVVIGGHLDSWDVGEGAQDDGSGAVSALEAAHLIVKLGLRPRRTLRVVFWTDEEFGSSGGAAYRRWVGEKAKNHVALIEMDGGAEKPVGFGVTGQRALGVATEAGRLLERIGAGTITPGGGGADIEPLMKDGVPGLGLRTVGTHYFDWHHSPADTLDKIKPEELRLNIAAMAVMAYILADAEELTAVEPTRN